MSIDEWQTNQNKKLLRTSIILFLIYPWIRHHLSYPSPLHNTVFPNFPSLRYFLSNYALFTLLPNNLSILLIIITVIFISAHPFWRLLLPSSIMTPSVHVWLVPLLALLWFLVCMVWIIVHIIIFGW